MANKIWVKAAHPRAQLYQEVLDDNGDVVVEHVRGETVEEGIQKEVPVEVTHTQQVAQALQERDPVTRRPAIIVECSREEVREHLARKGRPALEEDEVEAEKPARRGAKADK